MRFISEGVKTSHGVIAVHRPAQIGPGPKRVALYLHGALRGAQSLAHLALLEEFPSLPVFVDIPGHGSSFHPDDVTIDTLTAPIVELIGGYLKTWAVVVVGECLGGLMALRLAQSPPTNLVACVANDPPLDIGKLPHVRRTMHMALAKYPGHPFIAALTASIFGVREGLSDENRDYRHLAVGISVPTVVLTGDRRPPNAREDDHTAALLGDDDLASLAASSPLISCGVIPDCGHLALVEQPRAVLSVVRTFCEGLGAEKAA
jgi:pimeloyl-ACP methyl ester carboxylesterase